MAVSKPIRHIRSNQPLSEWVRQLIDRRETLWFFVWRDLKVQYQKPIFGLIWSIFQPLVYFGIILLVMQVSGRTSNTDEMPFALYLISGLAIWNFITSSILGSINSIQANAGIIAKSHFPRFYLILAPTFKSLLDLLIMLLIVFALAIDLGHPISLSTLIWVPLVLILGLLSSLGWSAIAASCVVINRQIRHGIPVLLYALIFALPVFDSIRQLDNQILFGLYLFNPVAGAMETLRLSFGTDVSGGLLASWVGQSIFWFGSGVAVFRKTERTLADKV